MLQKKPFAIIYVSSATQGFTLEEASQITEIRREFARSKKVTGLLIYAAGNFLRFVEGEKSDVQIVVKEEIINGPQEGVIKLFEGNIEHLYFENYSLGVRIVGVNTLQPLDDFSTSESKEYLDLCLSLDDKAMKVLKKFIESNR